MPVFHTKTIETILEPVAQQVSQLVIIHEQGESGIAVPDLSLQVQGVAAAVANLVVVAKDTAANSKDAVLKKEMPTAYQKVEESSKDLLHSTSLLKQDPYSKEGRQKLLNGARGILSGTSALLLTFDDAEVRKILAQCRNVMDYLQVAEVIEVLPDLITFVKNLTPGITSMAKLVEIRIKELTHATHRELLAKHLSGVKNKIEDLIAAIKVFIHCLKGPGRAEAQENRNFLITTQMNHIIEIMRVLQLKVDDEYDLEDPTNLLRKARHYMVEKMQSAKDWLANPDADANGLGERALRDILKHARQIGELANDPRIKQLCDELDQMVDRLAVLRAKGMGHSPEALKLAQDIASKLNFLQELVDQAIAREAASGSRLPAATTDGQIDQALAWIDDPRADPNGIGNRAIGALVGEGRRMAEGLPEPQRSELLATCANVERLAKQLATLKAQGKGSTPEAARVAAELKRELEKLRVMLTLGATRRVVDDFMDPKQPIKQLEKAARAPAGVPNREQEYEDKAGAFEYHTSKMVEAAEQSAVNGKNTNRQLAEGIRAATKELAEMTPQVSHAGKLLLLNPGEGTAEANFNQMRNNWINKCDELTGLVDAAIDAVDFVKESETAIRRDYEAALVGLQQANAATVVSKGGDMARRSHRVTQVAQSEAENSEDPAYGEGVRGAANILTQAIAPHVHSTKQVAMNPRAKEVQVVFNLKSDELLGAVADVRKALEPFPPPPDVSQIKIEEPEAPPPPRPPAPVIEGVIESDESRELQSMLDAPDSDNRIAVAAHQLHQEAKKWDEEGNPIISAARRMALLFAKMSRFITDEEYCAKHSKKELIDTAKMIAAASSELVKEARKVANECPDKRMKNELLTTIDRIPTVATQLKILATVKATMFGANDPQADFEATEMLVGCAENLMGGAKQVVRDCEAASIKIRTGQGQIHRWKPQPAGAY